MNTGLYTIRNMFNVRERDGKTYVVFENEERADYWMIDFLYRRYNRICHFEGYYNALELFDDWEEWWISDAELAERFCKEVITEFAGGGELFFEGNTYENKKQTVDDMNAFLAERGFPGNPVRDVHLFEDPEEWQWLLISKEQA